MPLSVEVAKDEDMHELMQVLWTCFENPPQGILRVFFPILNNDRDASLRAASDGQRDEYKEAYPELIWLKVVDDETRKIIAGAKWYFYERNPFAAKPGDDTQSHGPLAEEAVWYPEGVGRDLATAVCQAFEKPGVEMGQRPHSCRAMLDWGLAKADQLGLESWLDGSVFGFPLYQRVGFLTYGSNNVSVDMPKDYTEQQQAEWEAYKKTMLPIEQAVMWRPAGGKFVIGQTVTPWFK